jgi:hypothetical protein
MAAANEEWITELLGGVSSQDKGKLIELLSQIKQHLNEPPIDDRDQVDHA